MSPEDAELYAALYAERNHVVRRELTREERAVLALCTTTPIPDRKELNVKARTERRPESAA